MSIEEHILAAIEHGWLVGMPPSFPSVPHQRIILASRRLFDEVCDELQNPATAHRTAQLLATLDTFIGGEIVTIGSRNDSDAYMKKLENAEEVWEIRSVAPKPSIRVFGRFAKIDVFVATSKHFRTELGGYNSPEFRDAISFCKSQWRRCFPTWDAHKGESVYDYISDSVVDLRDL